MNILLPLTLLAALSFNTLKTDSNVGKSEEALRPAFRVTAYYNPGDADDINAYFGTKACADNFLTTPLGQNYVHTGKVSVEELQIFYCVN